MKATAAAAVARVDLCVCLCITSVIRSLFQADSTLKGVINSFVEVEDYKKKGQLDVRFLLGYF